MIQRACSLLAAAVISVVMAGCASPAYLASNRLSARLSTIHTVRVLPARCEIFSVGADTAEKIDEWSEIGARNITAAVRAELEKHGSLEVKLVEAANISEDSKSDLEQAQLLFEAVSLSVRLFIYGPIQQRLSNKISNFDYSLGAEMAKIQPSVDAFVIVRARDRIFTTVGRATMLALSVSSPAGLLLMSTAEQTTVDIGLVDARSGDILWYGSSASAGSYDLRDPTSAANFVKNVLADFPVK